MNNHKKFYINGAWVDPISSTDFDVLHPGTEEAIATIALGSRRMSMSRLPPRKRPLTHGNSAVSRIAWLFWNGSSKPIRRVQRNLCA